MKNSVSKLVDDEYNEEFFEPFVSNRELKGHCKKLSYSESRKRSLNLSISKDSTSIKTKILFPRLLSDKRRWGSTDSWIGTWIFTEFRPSDIYQYCKITSHVFLKSFFITPSGCCTQSTRGTDKDPKLNTE